MSGKFEYSQLMGCWVAITIYLFVAWSATGCIF